MNYQRTMNIELMKKIHQPTKKEAGKKAEKKPRTNQSSTKYRYLLMAGICLLAFLVFREAVGHGWTNWDDPNYVLENEELTLFTWDNVLDQFTSYYFGNYHPLTMVSYLTEYHFCQSDPKLYHLDNILLHLLNTALVFILFYRLSRKISVAAIVCVLFGVHPMHVESVAWVSERKDMVYSFFFLLSLIFYTDYVRKGAKNYKKYMLVLFFFILSLLSKAMSVTLPLVLLLIDYFQKRAFSKQLILEKIPFFILSVIFGIVAVRAQQTVEAIAAFETFTLIQRIMFASYAVLYYIFQLVIPNNMSGFHPYPLLIDDRLPMIFYFAPFIVLALVGLVYWSILHTRIVAFGFLFFLGTISLVLQFITVGKTIVSDRYTYIPYLGLFFIIAHGYGYIEEHKQKWKLFALAGLLIATGVLSWITFHYNKTWKNTGTLWANVISRYPYESDVHYQMGKYLAENSHYDEAMSELNLAIKLNVKNGEAYIYRGNIFGINGQHELALADYNKAEELKVNNIDVYVNRAITYSILKNYEKAFPDYEKALKNAFSAKSKIYLNRALAYLGYGDADKAIEDCNAVLALSTVKNDEAYIYRGIAQHRKKNFEEAIVDYDRAIKINPGNGNAYINRSDTWYAKGNLQQAWDDAMTAQKLGQKVNPEYLEIVKKGMKK